MTNSRYRDGHLAVRDGLRVHYRDYPGSANRPPILCLHGLTRNARDFAAFGERYSPDFRVLALDFRGRGESDYDPLPARYNPLTYAGDVLELLDSLHLDRAVFVGTSLGGLVTMTMAVTAPQRIAAAILNDVGPELSQAGLDRIQGYVGKDEQFASWDEAARAIAANQAVAYPSYGEAEWLATARRNCRERDGKILFDYDPAAGHLQECRRHTEDRHVAAVRRVGAEAAARRARGAQRTSQRGNSGKDEARCAESAFRRGSRSRPRADAR